MVTQTSSSEPGGRPLRVVALLGAAALSRTAAAAMPLVLLLTLAKTYGFGESAVIDGGYTVLLATLAILKSRVFDRIGSRRLFVASGAVSAAGSAVVPIATALHLSGLVPLLGVIVAGLVAPPFRAALRVSWGKLAQSDDELRRLHSADSILEELGFIAGPSLAGLALLFMDVSESYWIVLGVSVLALSLYGAAGFKAWELETEEKAPAAEAGSSQSELARVGRWMGALALVEMRRTLLPMLMMGFVFGSLGILIPAYAVHRHEVAMAGPLVALISVGGVIGGALYGLKSWSADLFSKYRLLSLGFACAVVTLLTGTNVIALGMCLVACGLTVTPLYISGYLLVATRIPSTVAYEANTLLGASTDVANGFGAVMIGQLVARSQWAYSFRLLGGFGIICAIALSWALVHSRRTRVILKATNPRVELAPASVD